MRPTTPRGFRDVLPQEAAERERVVRAMTKACSAWGYDPVETPVLETYSALERAGSQLEGTAFRLFDVDGSLLALRPDMTLPIARVAAARLSAGQGVLRLRYTAEVFREHESLRGQSRQFTQLGVELVGACGPAADAEIVALSADVLQSSGLADYTIAVGSVRVLDALLGASGMSEDWRTAVMAALHARNLVELDRLVSVASVPETVAEALRRVPRTRGEGEALAAARALLARCGCDGALDELERTWEFVSAAVPARRAMVDLGVVRDFDYYSGIVMEVYAPGIGVPIAGGGRYDGVLGRFGAPAPAAGFAVGLERLMIALAEQGATIEVADRPARVAATDVAGFLEAARRRAAGERIALDFGDGGAS